MRKNQKIIAFLLCLLHVSLFASFSDKMTPISVNLESFPDDLAAVIGPQTFDSTKAWHSIYKATRKGRLNKWGQAGQPAINLLLQRAGFWENERRIDELIDFLMSKKGFNPNEVNIFGETILIEVLRSFDVGYKHKYLKKLLELKANPNQGTKLWTPLYEAVMRNDHQAVELLLQHGAKINLGSKNGTTPIHLAIKDGKFKIANLLIEKKADLNIKNNKNESAMAILNRLPSRTIIDYGSPKMWSLVALGPNKSKELEVADFLAGYSFSKRLVQTVIEYLASPPALALGTTYTCLINDKNEIEYWGDTILLKEFKHAKQISAGNNHLCVINTNDQLECKGYNGSGQTTVPENFKNDVKQVSAGFAYTCAVKTNNQLSCWGNDHSGQIKVPDDFKDNVKVVSAGSCHTCAININNQLSCWGDYTSHQTAVPNDFNHDVKQVSAGGDYTCAVKISGRLSCWGDNSHHQTSIPNDFKHNVNQVSAGLFHACAIKTDGQLSCWGENNNGQINVPDEFKTDVKQVFAGFNHTCAIKTNDKVGCWGLNERGQCEEGFKF